MNTPSELKEQLQSMYSKWQDQYDMWRGVMEDSLMYTKEDRLKAGNYAGSIASMKKDLKEVIDKIE